jgi:hypothetical protein
LPYGHDADDTQLVQDGISPLPRFADDSALDYTPAKEVRPARDGGGTGDTLVLCCTDIESKGLSEEGLGKPGDKQALGIGGVADHANGALTIATGISKAAMPRKEARSVVKYHKHIN